MAVDWCAFHGTEHMRYRFGDPIAYCEACEADEPPQQWFQCDACNGSGEEVFGYWGYEPGCGHGHMMDDGRPCSKCGGIGGRLDDADADHRQDKTNG